ncbi:glycosyltransferase [Candidatus Saccharibacteria bacterium]|nr:glycosyltransferase [Candidatus Saccharibacteria bacterium]
MKIAIFTDVYTNGAGGIPVSIAREKRTLEAEGHLVYVFTPGVKKFREKNVFRVPSVKITRANGVPFPAPASIIVRFVLKNYPEVAKFDVIHTHWEAGCSIAGLKLGKKLGIPTVQTMHGREDSGIIASFHLGLRCLIAEVLTEVHRSAVPHRVKVKRGQGKHAKTFPQAKMWELMVAQANFADAVVCPSEHFSRKLKAYGVSRPCYVVPNGVEAELLKRVAKLRHFSPENEPLRIIFSARVAREKRLLTLLSALSMLSPDQKYELEVYGRGNELLKARQFAKIKRLKVKFYGNARRETILKALDGAHLSATVSYDYDTQGYTILEAVASGCPVLLSDPDLMESVPEGGGLVAKDASAEALAREIRRVFEEPERIEKMSRKIAHGRPEISETKQAERLVKIFRDLQA